MESKWGPRAFLRAYQDEVRFGKLILPFWGPSGGQVGLMLATFSEVFEFPRRSLKEVRFQDDFEAIGERLGESKTSVSLQRGCKNRLSEDVHFGSDLGGQNGAKMESKSVCKSF